MIKSSKKVYAWIEKEFEVAWQLNNKQLEELTLDS